MNTKTKDVVRYLAKTYPCPYDLTRARLVRLLFLVDQERIEQTGEPLTNIRWTYGNYGPNAPSVTKAMEKDRALVIQKISTNMGPAKYIVRANTPLPYTGATLKDKEKESIEKVIEETRALSWNRFVEYMYEKALNHAKNHRKEKEMQEIAK